MDTDEQEDAHEPTVQAKEIEKLRKNPYVASVTANSGCALLRPSKELGL